MLASFGLAGSVIPLGLAAFLASAIINEDSAHTAVIVVGAVLGLCLVCTFGSMWIGASVMLMRTASRVFRPRVSKSSDQGQADIFEDLLAAAAKKDCCGSCATPCRIRRH
jgi:hypothetical protein